jgi:hypothetical protein
MIMWEEEQIHSGYQVVAYRRGACSIVSRRAVVEQGLAFQSVFIEHWTAISWVGIIAFGFRTNEKKATGYPTAHAVQKTQ